MVENKTMKRKISSNSKKKEKERINLNHLLKICYNHERRLPLFLNK